MSKTINVIAALAALILALALGLAACGSRPATPHVTRPAASTHPAAAPSKPTATRPAATPMRTPTPRPTPQPPATQPPPTLTNGVAVVSQYYQDITDQNYAAAWAIGGSNIAAQNGQSYASWVAGYADTTASISIASSGTWSNGTVWCYIHAVQLDGTVNIYYGTYDVAGGEIVSASIRQA